MVGTADAAEDRTVSGGCGILILLCGVAYNLDQLVLVCLCRWLILLLRQAEELNARQAVNSIVTCDNFFIFGFSLVGLAGNGSPAAFWGVAGEG